MRAVEYAFPRLARPPLLRVTGDPPSGSQGAEFLEHWATDTVHKTRYLSSFIVSVQTIGIHPFLSREHLRPPFGHLSRKSTSCYAACSLSPIQFFLNNSFHLAKREGNRPLIDNPCTLLSSGIFILTGNRVFTSTTAPCAISNIGCKVYLAPRGEVVPSLHNRNLT